MTIDRREFITRVGLAAAGLKLDLSKKAVRRGSSAMAKLHRHSHGQREKSYGSGHFGEWINDEFGLPAFHYTCDQEMDPKAVTKVNPGILSSTEHVHQVGNDRLIAVVSNYGSVRVRQDEGAPKFLNDYAPEKGYFGGGIGYLTDGETIVGTAYPGGGKSFDRIFGVGYFQKKVTGDDYSVDHIIFAPFGDDPVLISQVRITNHGKSAAKLRWVEYWGCQPYEFSFRSFIEMFSGKPMVESRRTLGDRFTHHFELTENGAGLLETKQFLGRTKEEEAGWQRMLNYLSTHPNPFLAAPSKESAHDASFDDPAPPATFLVSLDGPADAVAANGKEFFGSGGLNKPSGISRELDGDLKTTGAESALLLERRLSLKRGESRTLRFLYGYLPEGTELKPLIAKYRHGAESELERTCSEWKKKGLRFSVPGEPWVNREVNWNHYYTRSSLTYDSFFKQHIISQGSVYQYVMGFQGAARDPLQHVLPFIFSDPEIVKGVLRYTLKEVRRDGSIPYGIVGHGMVMPTASDNSSDMPLWLLWAVSEYVLATRDRGFLEEPIPAFLLVGATGEEKSVRQLLALCYRHLIEDVKTGEHGIMRMLHDDWNDALVQGWVPPKDLNECLEKSESVVNSAMAGYVFDLYARLLDYAGDSGGTQKEVRSKAREHREAVAAQWNGQWYRRAWLGPTLGWLGEKGLWLEPQPWAIISGAADRERTEELVQAIDRLLRQPSPIGAMQMNKSPDMLDNGMFQAGTSITGGIWPSLNQTLIWALALVNGEMAWDEWKKNSFARQKEVYPDIWYQTWSGTDTINSILSKKPGETTSSFGPFGWTDFPVFNVHSHACSLYSAARLLGLEFTETGLTLAPKLPMESYRFESPLLGLIKSTQGYEGWYEPSGGTIDCTIHFKLPREVERGRIRRVEVSGSRRQVRMNADSVIELRGEAGPRKPIRWKLDFN